MFDTRFSGKNAFRYMKELSFERFGGTPGEWRAAEIILSFLTDLGYDAHKEEFEVTTYRIIKSELYLDGLEVPCVGVGLSGNTDDAGVEGELIYIEGEDYPFEDLKGKIILFIGNINFETYKKLVKSGIKAVIRVEDNPRRLPARTDIIAEWRRVGEIPMVRISYLDALNILEKGYSNARIVLKQEISKSKSYNVVAEKRGSTRQNEIIVVGGHYDSERETIGACDNLGGTAMCLELARIFSSERNLRTIRFIFFGSEELGLVGSRKYIKAHEKELEKIKLMINLDVHGQTIGIPSCIVSGGKDLETYISILAKELGCYIRVSSSIMSSDSSSFTAKGIPAVSFFRSGGSGFFIHTPEDEIRYVSPRGLESVGILIEHFLRRVLNAKVFPFKREIPEDIKKKIDKYFRERLGIELKGATAQQKS